MLIENKDFIAFIADRNYDKKTNWMPSLIEDGCSFPSKLPEKIVRKIETLIYKIIKKYGIRRCAVKFDLILRNNVIYVLECPPRLGGGYLSSKMIEMATGFDYWKAALEIAMGLPISSQPIKQKFTAQRYFFPKEGVTSHRDRCGSVEVVADTYEEAVKLAQEKINAN